MPLAMAKVLQVPVMILTPHYLSPFIPVFPRQQVDCVQPFMLAYDNNGPGHYDALIPIKEQEEPSNTVPAYQEKNVAGKNKKYSSFCRCGINVRPEKISKRSYKSRCKCISLNAKCSSKCKCSGECGDVHCQKNIKLSFSQPLRKKRASWKGRKHPMTLTPTETPKKADCIETGPPNALEYFVTFAIVKYVVLKGLSDSYEEISVLLI